MSDTARDFVQRVGVSRLLDAVRTAPDYAKCSRGTVYVWSSRGYFPRAIWPELIQEFGVGFSDLKAMEASARKRANVP